MTTSRLYIWISVFTLMGMLLSGCRAHTSEVIQSGLPTGMNAQISDCGGFEALRAQESQDSQCRGERLNWQYDQSLQSVRLLNRNVWLNCCGEHALVVTLNAESGSYQLYETDDPGESRCRCMCFFDFQIDLPHIPPERISLEIYRHITDAPPQWLVWQGIVDVRQGNGSELILTNIGWCN